MKWRGEMIFCRIGQVYVLRLAVQNESTRRATYKDLGDTGLKISWS